MQLASFGHLSAQFHCHPVAKAVEAGAETVDPRWPDAPTSPAIIIRRGRPKALFIISVIIGESLL